MRILCLLSAFVLLAGCHKNGGEPPFLKATVRTINNGCSPIVLDFSADSAALRLLTGKPDLIWAPKGLPAGMAHNDQKVFVKVTDRLSPGEQDVCVTVWTYYPRIKLLETKPRD